MLLQPQLLSFFHFLCAMVSKKLLSSTRYLFGQTVIKILIIKQSEQIIVITIILIRSPFIAYELRFKLEQYKIKLF